MTGRKTRQRCRPPADICEWCGHDRYGRDGGTCEAFDVRGRPRVPLSWPDDLGIPAGNPCQCGTQVGGLHHHECDIELCPWADEHPDDGEQLLYCGCL